MALILKSDMTLETGNLKSKIDLEPVAAADFVGEKYTINGQNVGLDDVVVVANDRYAGKLDAFGDYHEVTTEAVPVIGSDPGNLTKGLLVDNPPENFFIDGSSNPRSFNRQLALSKSSILLLKITGEGSATLKVGGEVIGTATEQSPQIYKPTQDTSAVNIEVVTQGSVTFGGLYRVLDARPSFGRYDDNLRYAKDTVSVSPSVLDAAVPAMRGCVVIKSALRSPQFDRGLTTTQSYLLAQIINKAAGSQARGFSVAFRENSDIQYVVRGYDTKEKTAPIYRGAKKPLETSNTIAVNFSKTSVKVALNGEIVASLALASEVPIDTINLASGYWGETTPQLVESYMLYDRNLTDDELIKVTS